MKVYCKYTIPQGLSFLFKRKRKVGGDYVFLYPLQSFHQVAMVTSVSCQEHFQCTGPDIPPFSVSFFSPVLSITLSVLLTCITLLLKSEKHMNTAAFDIHHTRLFMYLAKNRPLVFVEIS